MFDKVLNTPLKLSEVLSEGKKNRSDFALDFAIALKRAIEGFEKFSKLYKNHQ